MPEQKQDSHLCSGRVARSRASRRGRPARGQLITAGAHSWQDSAPSTTADTASRRAAAAGSDLDQSPACSRLPSRADGVPWRLRGRRPRPAGRHRSRRSTPPAATPRRSPTSSGGWPLGSAVVWLAAVGFLLYCLRPPAARSTRRSNSASSSAAAWCCRRWCWPSSSAMRLPPLARPGRCAAGRRRRTCASASPASSGGGACGTSTPPAAPSNWPTRSACRVGERVAAAS